MRSVSEPYLVSDDYSYLAIAGLQAVAGEDWSAIIAVLEGKGGTREAIEQADIARRGAVHAFDFYKLFQTLDAPENVAYGSEAFDGIVDYFQRYHMIPDPDGFECHWPMTAVFSAFSRKNPKPILLKIRKRMAGPLLATNA